MQDQLPNKLLRYRTVQGEGCGEIVIQKSRFLAYVKRAETEADALHFIERIRKQHWDATHNCTAYVVGDHDQFQKANDDGEPAGTAGKPMLEVLKKSGLKDTVVVVTRYFGGVKLGAGGLVRAYSKAVSAGLAAVGVIERTLHRPIAIGIDYSQLGRVERELRTAGIAIAEIRYLETVTVVALAEAGQEEEVEKKAIDWTAGQALLERLAPVWVDRSVSCNDEELS
ncbi:YigZ family protein [Heliophilum fasciatum]|uniref:YigZ family protein n=1 Tax=Heliophilum fasciatum TaxID=35700 RepID=UPI001FAB2B4C|nr:YigZ family protein [Heliophilum fasciatum]MCW2278096.1 putative YigZ family protein [Heliophilum fasciatum]